MDTCFPSYDGTWRSRSETWVAFIALLHACGTYQHLERDCLSMMTDPLGLRVRHNETVLGLLSCKGCAPLFVSERLSFVQVKLFLLYK